MSFASYRYRAIVEWTDPDDGAHRQVELDLHQLSAGQAGRLMTTQVDGITCNFPDFNSVRLVRIEQ